MHPRMSPWSFRTFLKVSPQKPPSPLGPLKASSSARSPLFHRCLQTLDPLPLSAAPFPPGLAPPQPPGRLLSPPLALKHSRTREGRGRGLVSGTPGTCSRLDKPRRRGSQS